MDFESGKPQEFSSVTQCPYCQTAFHVGLAQLDVAGGRVRCGGCLRVFNAKDHFLVEQQRLFDDEPYIEETTDASAKDTEISLPEVDLFGDDIPDEDEPVILGSFNHYSGTSIPRKAILEDKVDEFRQEDYEPASAEEVLGEHQHLLEPEQDISQATSEPDSGDDDYVSLWATDPDDDEDPIEIKAIRDEEADPAHTEVESPEEQIRDETPVGETVDETADEPVDQTTEAEPWINIRKQFQPEDFREELPENEQLEAPGYPLENGESEDTDSKDDHTDHFFIHQVAKHGRRVGALWWAALVLVILALPAQLLFTQPESLVIKSWFRQIGAALCPHLGCPIPVYSAPGMIRISGFVEPHDEYQDSLVAKIDLRNQGLSEQPFPPIAVYFRNLNGAVTASRVFQPSEYLKGEARGYQNMPLNRTFQLELEFLDPGEQSTSYELYIAN